MKANRYVYSVGIWDPEADIIIGEGSGPASHVIANLERMIEEIRAAEGLNAEKATAVGHEAGWEFFHKLSAGEARSEDWPQYLLDTAAAEMRVQYPDMSDEELQQSLEELKRTPEFGLAVQGGLQTGQLIEQTREMAKLREANGS